MSAKIKPYSVSDLEDALIEISEGLSVYAASKKYKIPETTLRQYKNGNRQGKQGRKLMFAPEIEQEIVVWLKKCAARGSPVTKEQVLETVWQIRRKISMDLEVEAPSKRWFKDFLQRNSSVTLRTPQAITKSSANVSETDIRRWFEIITAYLTNENLLHLINDSSRFINCDETGFELNHKPGKVFAQKGGTNAGPSDRISVMYTFGADGYSFSPQIILKSTVSRKKIHEMTVESVGEFKTRIKSGQIPAQKLPSFRLQNSIFL